MAAPAADFYNAKDDGAVDIGNNYQGTGAGETSTLTADLFHQHGDIQVMQSWETPFMAPVVSVPSTQGTMRETATRLSRATRKPWPRILRPLQRCPQRLCCFAE